MIYVKVDLLVNFLEGLTPDRPVRSWRGRGRAGSDNKWSSLNSGLGNKILICPESFQRVWPCFFFVCVRFLVYFSNLGTHSH